MATNSATVEPPPALNLASVKKTALDLFAVAPQAKKLTRRAKAQLDVEAAKPPSSRAPDDDLFRSVFIDAAEGTGDEKTAKEGGKRPRRATLRHHLHANPEEDARTVFVGNLPNTIARRAVARFFKDCGPLESARVRAQALEAADATSAQAGRAIRVLRGELRRDAGCSATAYVLFRDRASVARALAKNGLVLEGRHVVVTTLAAGEAAYPPETSVFLGNVAYDASEEAVRSFFVEQGVADVKRVRLVRDRDSGACKGFGYVEFLSPASVQPAIALRGGMLNGRELRIVHANKSKAAAATVASRREKRSNAQTEGGHPIGGGKRQRHAAGGEGGEPRDRKAKRNRVEKAGEKRAGRAKKSELPSWVGVVTNPRRKIPKDLRSLIGDDKPKPKGPRPPVKHKMRNPEK